MRRKACLLLTLACSGSSAQVHYCVGTPRPGPLYLYEVTALGEITQRQQTAETSTQGEAPADRAGRFVMTYSSARIHLFRVSVPRHLELASSVEAVNASQDQVGFTALGLSQDGRILLVRHSDQSVDPPLRDFRTFVVNNRLSLVDTGHRFTEAVPGLHNFVISDRGRYTALLNRQPSRQLTIMHITPEGEMSLTGATIQTPDVLSSALDLSADG